MPISRERKGQYFERLDAVLATYSKLFIVGVDNVGSRQMQNIRQALRGKGEVMMGKNTMMRKVISNFMIKNPDHPIGIVKESLRGNVGFIFTNGDLALVRDVVKANRRPAPAKVGAIAPINVVVPPGPTGCDPGQTAFFQALNIGTKIQKGQIEIVNPVNLIMAGEKIGSSEAVLLQKLNIKPFDYGLNIISVYEDGSIFDPKVLDMSQADLANKFMAAINNIAAASLALNYPTLASLPHSVANAYKNLLAVAVTTEYSWPNADKYKAYLADPSAFAGSAPAAAAAPAGGAAPAAAKKVEVEEEKEEVDMGMDLFGGGGDAGGGGKY